MRALPLVAVVVLVGCGASTGQPSAPTTTNAAPTAPSPLRGYVLMKPTAIFHTAPSDTAPPLQLFASDDEASRAAQDDPYPVFRVVEEKNGFVQVETTFEPDHFCHDGLLGVHEYRLRFFARRDAFALVTPTAIDVDYADGSSITLSSGVTARAIGGAIEVNPSGTWLPTPITSDGVADSFDPSPPFPTPKDPYGELSATPKAGVRFAGRLFPAFPSTHQPAASEWIEVQEAKELPGHRLLVTIVERCARYRVVVGADDVDQEIGGIGGLGMYGKMAGGFAVRRGATIYWKNGQIAGSTREELVDLQGVVQSGKRWCWPVALRMEGGPKVDVCVDEKDRM